MDVQHTKHVTYKLAYHFVWCPRYRKKLLIGKIALFVEQELHRICEANTWTIGALNVQEDHVHLFLSTPPSIAPSQMAHTLKGTTARKVFQCFPEVKKQRMPAGHSDLGPPMLGVSGIRAWMPLLKYIELGQD